MTYSSSSPGHWAALWSWTGLWRRLRIDTTMTRLLAGRRRDEQAERVLFALVGTPVAAS
jgi:hypothetical protein